MQFTLRRQPPGRTGPDFSGGWPGKGEVKMREWKMQEWKKCGVDCKCIATDELSR